MNNFINSKREVFIAWAEPSHRQNLVTLSGLGGAAKIYENKFLLKNLDLALDLLIFKIYNKIKNIPSLKIIILAFCIKIFLVNKGLLFVYLSNILFLGGFSIELVIIIQYLINCKEFKDNSPLLYYIFKYFLFGLLLFTLYKLVIICLNFLVWIKTSLLNK